MVVEPVHGHLPYRFRDRDLDSERRLFHRVEYQRKAHLAVLGVCDCTVFKRLLDATLAALFDVVHRPGVVVIVRECPVHVSKVQTETVGDSPRVENALFD
jgi:hypothetical protein